MAQYKEGTVAVTNASQVVTGTLTLWSAEIVVGDLFTVANSNVIYEIGSVDSDTQITLNANYAGSTQAGLNYSITRDFTPNFTIPYLSKGDIDTATTLKRAMEIIDAELNSVAGPDDLLIVITGTVDLTSATTQNIGGASDIPANGIIIGVNLDITVASDVATTVTVGDVTNGAAAYMAALENDPEITGLYIVDAHITNGAGARQAQATVATAGTVGTAICSIVVSVP